MELENYSEMELIDIGLGFLDTERYIRAIDFFSHAIAVNPQSSQAYEFRGLAWLRLLEDEKAIADTEQAIGLDPENFNALANLGGIYLGKQDYGKAETYYQKSLDIFPESLQNLTSLAFAQFHAKKYDECIQTCNQILSLSSDDKWSLTYRSQAYGCKKEYPAAINDQLFLLKIDPENAFYAYLNIGFYYGQMRRVEESRTHLATALKMNPHDAYGNNNMGFTYYLEDDYEEALRYIDHSLNIDPSNSYAYKNRALVYLALGKREVALKDLQTAQTFGYSVDYDEEVNELLKKEFGL